MAEKQKVLLVDGDNQVYGLRRILDDTRESPRYIETVPAQGYRFVGPVEAIP
jgi:DNA-binding winged helix-turn-helix (wHTH) protein